MVEQANPGPTVDERVLAYFQSRRGYTAYLCALATGLSREEVSKSLRRLKRRGLMKNEQYSPYWEWQPPTTAERNAP